MHLKRPVRSGHAGDPHAEAAGAVWIQRHEPAAGHDDAVRRIWGIADIEVAGAAGCSRQVCGDFHDSVIAVYRQLTPMLGDGTRVVLAQLEATGQDRRCAVEHLDRGVALEIGAAGFAQVKQASGAGNSEFASPGAAVGFRPPVYGVRVDLLAAVVEHYLSATGDRERVRARVCVRPAEEQLRLVAQFEPAARPDGH